MPYKTMITVAAAVGLIFALAFAAVPKFFVLGTFPGAEGLALDVGIYYRYVMAAMIFMVVCVTFQTRNVGDADNQKEILLGVGAAFAVMCATIISRHPSKRTSNDCDRYSCCANFLVTLEAELNYIRDRKSVV